MLRAECRAHARTPNINANIAREWTDRLLLRTLQPALGTGPKHADAFLVRVCECGVVGGLMLVLAQFRAAAMLQAVQVPLMVALWWCYFVIKRLTKLFSSLPWDELLLEYGAVALPLGIPLVPSSLLFWAVVPLLLLVFKLMFSGGVVKIRSRCKCLQRNM